MNDAKNIIKNSIALDILPCPSDYKIAKETYILHLKGGYHFFNERCASDKVIKGIYREPIWPYLERIKDLENKNYKRFPVATVTKTDQYPKINLQIEGEKIKHETGEAYPTKTFYMHRIVGLATHPNLKNLPIINHINGNTVDYRPKNLEWSTIGDNNKGKRPRGSYNDLYDIMSLKGFV